MLIMDIGNSRIKWRSIGQQASQVRSEVYQQERISEQLAEWFDKIESLTQVVVCSVAASEVNSRVKRFFEAQNVNIDFTTVSQKKAGVSNGYKNVVQLGVDRWVAMVSAYNKYQTAVCVIDAGTALTVDVVDNQGYHLGGLIMPGLNLMQQSLLSGTAGINDVTQSSLLLADNTADAVSAGCVQLLIAGIRPLIERIESQYDLNLVSVVTGGDAELLVEQAGCGLILEKWLILDGLEQFFVKNS